ncbi:GntP family permease [Neobacillus sp. NPDC097160]|uniref:GntP family permease n=1 Tax=Neobacillus sp. NPDC097160 TaxID=3364298 RepID=UPI003826B680
MDAHIQVSALGAICALVIAIILILKKVSPAYGMIAGALIGGLIGGVDITNTVTLMMEGAKDIIPAVLRILAAGIFKVPLTSIMAAGIIPAIFGLLVTYFIAKKLVNKGSGIKDFGVQTHSGGKLPLFFPAIAAPLVTIILLALRPLFDISVDPIIALPVGGIAGALAMGRGRKMNEYAVSGLGKMSGVAIMLLGTGTLAGIIANSGLKDFLIEGLNTLGLPGYVLAPVSGIFMSAATASTTAGTAVASQVFSGTILGMGVSGLADAAMIHAGATVLDHLPHGSFFHATGGSVNMEIKERLKVIPYETLVGLTMVIISTLIFGVFRFFR